MLVTCVTIAPMVIGGVVLVGRDAAVPLAQAPTTAPNESPRLL